MSKDVLVRCLYVLAAVLIVAAVVLFIVELRLVAMIVAIVGFLASLVAFLIVNKERKAENVAETKVSTEHDSDKTAE